MSTNKFFIILISIQLVTTFIFAGILLDQKKDLDLWTKQVKIDTTFNAFIDYQIKFNKKVDDKVLINLR
jgi:hypothetical protein